MKTRFLYFVPLVFSLAVAPVSAAPPDRPRAVPDGPWVTDTQQVKLQGFETYEELVKSLKQAEKTSKGKVELQVIGYTNEGREIYLAKIGDGPKPVLIMAQQHGDEIHGSGAAVNVIKLLSTGSKRADDLLEQLTVLIIPRVNPDGFEVDPDGAGPQIAQRENVDPLAPPRDTSNGFYTREGQGWDINRFHYLDWTTSPVYAFCNDPVNQDICNYPDNPVPEAKAVVGAYELYNPIWVLDVHNQFTYRSDAGNNVTGSIMWPVIGEPPQDTPAVVLSKKMAVTIMDHMMQFGYAEVTRFPTSNDYAGIARNAYGIGGSGSLLAEIKGQEETGQKQKGMLVRHIVEMMMSLLEATADGSLDSADSTRVSELPERGTRYSKDLPANDQTE